MSTARPTVTVAIPSWNGRVHLETCLAALRAQVPPGVSWQTLVLDNASSDGTAEWMARHHPEVRVCRSAVNLGFAGGVNRLFEVAEGEFVALLNNDTHPEPEWLGELVAAICSAPPEVVAVAGLMVGWEGRHLDFAGGVMTFDGHAFQPGYRRPLEQVEIPAAASPLLFPCGANAILRRAAFEAVGGLDQDYFAYFEDVDLGWRLWSAGYQVRFAPQAVVRHRSMASSDLLGAYRRGVLFERNALLTAYKNYDDEHFARMMPAILWTLLHRTQSLLVGNNPGGATLAIDPFGRSRTVTPPADGETAGPVMGPPPATAWTQVRERWRRFGPGQFFRRGLGKLASRLLADGGPLLTDPRSVAQLQAVHFLLGHLDRAAEKRQQVQKSRRRPDAAIFERFPLYLVPTYPGDDILFASQGFAALLPERPELVRRTLGELMAP